MLPEQAEAFSLAWANDRDGKSAQTHSSFEREKHPNEGRCGWGNPQPPGQYTPGVKGLSSAKNGNIQENPSIWSAITCPACLCFPELHFHDRKSLCCRVVVDQLGDVLRGG